MEPEDELAWRRQHGRVVRAVTLLEPDKATGKRPQIVDAEGQIGDPHRGLTLLGQWELDGRISSEMRMAGDRFHELFHLASLDPLHAADMGRVGGSPAPMKHRGSLGAREELHAAVRALGGMGSPAGTCAWFVLGCEYSLRQWGVRESWRGRPMHPTMAAGVLVGTLAVLRPHFGY